MEQIKDLLASPHTNKRLLLGCTGSVATIKVPLIARALQAKGIAVIILPTEPSLHFLINSETDTIKLDGNLSLTKLDGDSSPTKVDNLSPDISCGHLADDAVGENYKWCLVREKYPDLTFVSDRMEWMAWQGRGDPVLHIELRKWADALLIAPLSANSLAKLAGGLCDNLLTCVVRAWDVAKPLLFCPAMNTHMYEHPLTTKQIAIVKEFGYKEIESVSKTLMCGDVGKGAMAPVDVIVDTVTQELGMPKSEGN